MLTKKSKYGLKAVLALAEDATGKPVVISDLAGRQRLPPKFLEAILLELKRNGLLQSKKGKGGGYLLSRPPSQVTLSQIIRVLDGPLALVPCVSQTAYVKCEECVDEDTCGVRLAMKAVRDATVRILDNMTLESLSAEVTRARHQGRRSRPPRGEAVKPRRKSAGSRTRPTRRT